MNTPTSFDLAWVRLNCRRLWGRDGPVHDGFKGLVSCLDQLGLQVVCAQESQSPLMSSLAAGVSHDSPRTQNVHISSPGASNTTKIPRENPQRDTERAKWWKRKKKREFLEPPTLRGPTLRGSTLRGPTLLQGPTLRDPTLQGPTRAPPNKVETPRRPPPPGKIESENEKGGGGGYFKERLSSLDETPEARPAQASQGRSHLRREDKSNRKRTLRCVMEERR